MQDLMPQDDTDQIKQECNLRWQSQKRNAKETTFHWSRFLFRVTTALTRLDLIKVLKAEGVSGSGQVASSFDAGLRLHDVETQNTMALVQACLFNVALNTGHLIASIMYQAHSEKRLE